ncbi:MAG: helix-turn-helix domain-containing protein [Oscillospiraceae bacterium]
MSEHSIKELSLGEIIGNTLADLRKNTGMTQKEFSTIFGVSESNIAHYEQGITIPSADMLLKYADYFNVNIDYLFGRCNCKIKYNQLNAPLSNDMKISEMINIVSEFSKSKRNYLYSTICLLSKGKLNNKD